MISRVIISVFVLICCVSVQASVVSGGAADLKFTEERFDFGCVGVDFKVYHTFKLTNTGDNPIHVDTVLGHCDCTEVRFLDSTIAPGDTSEVLIIFNTANFYGPIDKHITAISAGAGVTGLRAYYTANIGQWLMKLEPKPVSVFFLPTQKTKTAGIFNHALDEISVQDIYLDLPIVDIKPLRSAAGKGESLDFEITPKTTLSSGTHMTNYTITLDLHENTPPHRITIPVKVVRY
jgi:hypothetical protein